MVTFRCVRKKMQDVTMVYRVVAQVSDVVRGVPEYTGQSFNRSMNQSITTNSCNR